MPDSTDPAPAPSMGTALAALQAQSDALDALVGQAVDVGSSAMGEAGAAARKLMATSKSAVTRRLNGGRKILDQVGGPGAALAGQQLATQAEMVSLIPGAAGAAPPIGSGTVGGQAGHGLGAGGYIPGSAGEQQYIADNFGKPGFIPAGSLQQSPGLHVPGAQQMPGLHVPGSQEPTPTNPNFPPFVGGTIGQGPLQPGGTISQGPLLGPGPIVTSSPFGSFSFWGDVPGPYPEGFRFQDQVQPYWMDIACPSWAYQGAFNVVQSNGSVLAVDTIRWPVDPNLPPEQGGIPRLTTYSTLRFATIAQNPPYSCGGGTLGQDGLNGYGPGPYQTPGPGQIGQGPGPTGPGPTGPGPTTGPTVTQGPLPPIGTITQIGLPPINITIPPTPPCPPPIINLTCPSCGITSPVPLPTPLLPLPPEKKAPPIGWQDYLEIRSDGSYSVYVSLDQHTEFQTVVSQLLEQVVKNETVGEPNAVTDVPEYETDSELILDTWG